MKNVILFFCCFLIACQQDEQQMVEQQNYTERPAKKGVLQFHSKDELAETIAAMKEMNTLNLASLKSTRVAERIAEQVQDNEFISLRQHLVEQELREFTDAEMAEIIADSLEYEPEDSLIIDPYMMAILNYDREVQVGDKICRFIDKGLLMYDANSTSIFNPASIDSTIIVPDSLHHGDIVEVLDDQGETAELFKINYTPEVNFDEECGHNIPIGDHPYQGGNSNDSGNSGLGEEGSGNTLENGLSLIDGRIITPDKIKHAFYKQKNSDAGWFGKTLSGLFGKNVTVSNYYDKRHRMKLRLYEQDYCIYRAVGMTVRMQKRTLGIWWRKKAQVFHYGWSAMELKYKFPTPVFLDPPVMPNGQFEYNKYPVAMIKDFPFAETDIVLFHVPLVNYNVTTGSINKAFESGLKMAANSINQLFNHSEFHYLENNPRGLYTTPEGDRHIIIVYPQGEKIVYNSGREVVRWDQKWCSGNFLVGLRTSSSNWQISMSLKKISSAKEVSIVRGRVYGAVKYNNEWRACIIESK